MTNSDDDAHPFHDKGRELFNKPWEFLISVQTMKGLPLANQSEVAFAGRSNVGKSSLINGLTGRKALARTSNTPGRTQLLNFFYSDGVPLYLVDMPGYGYAAAPKEKIAAWTRLLEDYLRGRPNLKRVFLLVDARHGAKENDLQVMQELNRAAVPYQLVLTKADKLKMSEKRTLVDAMDAILRKQSAAHPRALLTSSDDGAGLDYLRAEIAALAPLA